MSNVLITHSYFYPLDAKQWRFKQPYPPLGTLLATSVIRETGLQVSIVDSGLQKSPHYIFPALKEHHPTYFIIYDDGFNYLTKMCLTVMRDAAFEMINEAKKHGSTIIINSSDATDHYEKYLSLGADYIIRGEGEETLKELLLALENKQSISPIQGLAFKEKENIILTPPRAVLRNLDSLPLPAWDLIDLEPYKKIWLKHHRYFSLNIATTRGCPYKCNWCAKPIYGNRYNTRTPENVVKEIELLMNQYHPDHFWMCDDIFGLKPDWIQKFSDQLALKKLKIKYKIQSRVDLLLEDDTIEALARSGAETVWVGAESGSQKILTAMDKGTTVAQIQQAAIRLKAHNIKVAFFLQFGYLGETKEDIHATLNMVLQAMPDEIGISVSYPLPGTVFYDKVKNQLKKKQNWSDSDDLAMMFQGTYGSQYYKTLHRYVHNRYRMKRGINAMRKGVKKETWKVRARSIASMLYNIPLSLYNNLELKRLESKHD